jgi:hypothetical protein
MPTSANRPKTPATFTRMWASALLICHFRNSLLPGGPGRTSQVFGASSQLPEVFCRDTLVRETRKVKPDQSIIS